jgi:outer membrane protein assembly factor BamB
MHFGPYNFRTLCFVTLALLAGIIVSAAHAQFPRTAANYQFELSDTVQFDRADGAALARLKRVEACLLERQWDEAVETLRQVMENAEGKLQAVTPSRYINLSDACQMQLAALPPEALRLYRARVDTLAQKWYEEGLAHRDAKLLNNVVQQALASSWGDKALMALGEIRLEEGDFSAARWCWQRILPAKTPPGELNTWPGYPDSTLDPAAVRARLVLVSILEGSPQRAKEELSAFVQLHGDARGRLGGREVRYAAALAELLSQSALWPKAKPAQDWPTFAGSPARNAIAPELIDVADVQWRATLRQSAPPQPSPVEPRRLAVADDPLAPLAFHPVLGQGRVFAADQAAVFAFRADTGQPAWGDTEPAIYREPADAPLAMPGPGDALGTPRYTLTIADDRLYARMGSPITNPPQQPGVSVASGNLVCLDLRAEGKLLWRVAAEEGWAFDGAPVVAAARLFIVMRRNDIRPQVHVACFDTTTARMRWRRFVCAAETPARGALAECTHTLLTLSGDTIYVNTNLGAVAALAVEDGRIHWLSLYPRARGGNFLRLAAHWQRELNPCLFDRGRLYVAPADSPKVYAFDAATGRILWPGRRGDHPADTPVQDPLDDVVHLLGVSGDCLIASGHKLYWINTDGPRAGNIAHVWPEGEDKLGYGRGLLAGAYVLWPTREKVYVFHQQTAQLKKEIELAPLGVRGGNLLVANGRLLIATPTELVLLGIKAGKKDTTVEITNDFRNTNSEIRDPQAGTPIQNRKLK